MWPFSRVPRPGSRSNGPSPPSAGCSAAARARASRSGARHARERRGIDAARDHAQACRIGTRIVRKQYARTVSDTQITRSPRAMIAL
jgi:hypothetical protein